MKSLQDFDDVIFDSASEVIGNFDEQRPLILMMMIDENQALGIIDCSRAMADESGKDIVAALIDLIGSRDDVAIVAFASEAWMLIAKEPMKEKDFPRPSQHPDRVECVVVSYSLAGGKRALAVHTIHRPAGEKPYLERGELRTEEKEGEVLEGRFFAERRKTH